HVLNSRNCVASDEFEACFEQQFFLKWIPDLHRWTVFARLLGQFARGKRCASKSVATCFSADVENRIPCALCSAARELFVTQHAETKNISQRIAFEPLIETNLAANGGNADAIAVMRDAANHACEQPAIRRHFRISNWKARPLLHICYCGFRIFIHDWPEA